MLEKYLVYEKDGVKNPFMHIKQKTNGEICFRFLNTSDERFDFHYTRHNNELHTRIYYKGMNPKISKTDAIKKSPVHEIKNLERIKAIILTEHTATKSPTETIKEEIPPIMIIHSSKYPKGLVDIIIYLNPVVPPKEVIETTSPTEFVQDEDFNPPLLILCFKHSVGFLELGVDMI